MGRRFSRILSAAKYYAAIDNYINYIKDATRRGSRVGQGEARPDSVILYVTPFGLDLGTGKKVQQSATGPAWQAYLTAFANRTVIETAVQADNRVPKLTGYKAARVNIISGRTATGVPKTSKITGMKYLDYGGRSKSIPFGRGTSGTETQAEAFAAIKAGITGANSIYLIAEKI